MKKLNICFKFENTKLFCLLFFMSLILHKNGYSTINDTAIVRVFGGPGSEYFYSLKQLPNSNLIMVGKTNYFGPGNNSVYVVMTDKDGNHIWSNVYGKLQIEEGFDLALQGDSAIILLGVTNSFGQGGYSGYIIKIDTLGNLIWEKTIGGVDWDFLNGICVLNDGSLILCGRTSSFSNGGYDGYIVKIDSQGNVVWERNIGNLNDESFKSVIEINNILYLCGTSTIGAGSINTSGYLVKMDEQGNLLNEYFFNSKGNDAFNNISNYKDSLLLCGISQHPDSVNRNLWFVLTDTSGNTIINKDENTIEDDFLSSGTIVTTDNLVFVGQKNPSGLGEGSMYIIRYDSNFNYLVSASFGDSLQEEGFDVQVLSDKRIAFCGYTTSYGAGNEDGYLVILKYDTITSDYVLDFNNYVEQLSPIGIIENNKFDKTTIFPNPSTGKFCFSSLTASNYRAIKLFNEVGEMVSNIAVSNRTWFDFSDLPKGIYIYEIESRDHFTEHGVFILH